MLSIISAPVWNSPLVYIYIFSRYL